MTGMDVDENDDTFYDDHFFDIPEDELRQLEQNAISFTQQEGEYVNAGQSRGAACNAAPLSRARARAMTPGLNGKQSNSDSGIQRRAQSRQQTTSINGIDLSLDENGLPLVVEEQPSDLPRRHLSDEVSQREQWRSDRYGQPNRRAQPAMPQAVTKPVPAARQQAPTQFQAYPGVTRHSRPVPQESFQTAASIIFEEDSLRTKIEELSASLVTVQDELLARKGEIQIIRAKQTEEEKIHRRELETLRKLKQEEAEKHKLAIEALNADKLKTTSDIQFMKKELGDETRKVQSLQRQLKERPLRDKPTNVEGTPKRTSNSLRDGFDEEDLMLMSPTKSGRRSNKGTPTANRKRKQPTGSEISVPPLVLRPSMSVSEDSTNMRPGADAISEKVQSTRTEFNTQRHLRIVQQVMAFRPSGSRDSMIEHLTRLTFPSDPNQSLGSIVLNATAKLGGKRLPGDLFDIFIGLWSRCLKEKYYICLSLLVEVSNYILDIDLFVVDATLISAFLPILQATAEINATSRFHLLARKDWLDNSERKQQEINGNINVTACLDLLLNIACLISDDRELVSTFWRSMSTDFVLMMLNGCQHVKDVTLMLQLLATSILPQTFGNICPVEQQAVMETYIVDRICYLLWENPKTLDSEVPYPKHMVCKLRIEAITLLSRLTIGSSSNPYDPSTATNHGTVFLANHVTAIARLVRSIYDETAALYLVTPSQALHANLVNSAVQILHFVLNSPAGREVDLQSKLSGTNGGAHKHRVVLTRLAFSEGVYIDRGITDETVRMATELLEDSITPDEATDLTAAFGGSIGRSGSTQQ